MAVPLAQKKESKGQNLAWALPDGTYKEQTLSLTELNDLQNFSEDTILFGRESAGVPEGVHKLIENRLKIPMKNNVRSLNIASSVAIVLAESLRQTELM